MSFEGCYTKKANNFVKAAFELLEHEYYEIPDDFLEVEHGGCKYLASFGFIDDAKWRKQITKKTGILLIQDIDEAIRAGACDEGYDDDAIQHRCEEFRRDFEALCTKNGLILQSHIDEDRPDDLCCLMVEFTKINKKKLKLIKKPTPPKHKCTKCKCTLNTKDMMLVSLDSGDELTLCVKCYKDGEFEKHVLNEENWCTPAGRRSTVYLLGNGPPCIDTWLGDDDRPIYCYDEKYEDRIWEYYDKKKFYLKHKGYEFLMVDCLVDDKDVKKRWYTEHWYDTH